MGTNGPPPYSPDFAPSDFHHFIHLKKFLGGKRFDDDDDLKDAVQKWLTSQAAAFYEGGIQKLVPRYDKCINNGANMWKNSLKNEESDNKKNYTKTYSIILSETVLTLLISLVCIYIYVISIELKCNADGKQI